jgi:membrane-bound serine protease (ClpP class)
MAKFRGLIIALIASVILLMAVPAAVHVANQGVEPNGVGNGKSVLVINLTGTITSGSENMFRSVLSGVNKSNVEAVIININAGGGMVAESLAIDKYINSTENAGIKVYIYVMPQGSASYTGSYIAMDATGIYMAPGTTIGLSTPYLVGGTNSMKLHDKEYLESVMGAMASSHGRNSSAAEGMVANDSDYTTSQAIDMHLANGRANSFNALLNNLNLTGYRKIYINESAYDSFLGFLSNPLTAGLFILIGIVSVFFDLYHGTVALSIIGVVMIGLGLLGADLINASIFGLLLLLLASVLIFLEFKTNHGISLLAGLITGIAGVYFLASSYGTYNPGYSPNPYGPGFYLSAIAIVLIGVLMVVYISRILKSQTREHFTGIESIIGHSAEVKTEMGTNEKGFVAIEGVQWHAMNIDVEVHKNDHVIVIERKGLTLIVKKI